MKPLIKYVSQIRRMSFGMFYYLLLAFTLVGSVVYSDSELYSKLSVYMLMTAVFYAFFNRTHPLMKIPLDVGIVTYSLFLLGAGLVFSILRTIFGLMPSQMFNVPFSYMLLLYGLVVSFNEDAIFSYGPLPRAIGPLWSALLFATFHVFVYFRDVGWVIGIFRFIIAFISGLIFQYIAKTINPVASSAVHTAYNLVITGYAFSFLGVI